LGKYIPVCGPFLVSPLYPRAAFEYSPEGIIAPTTSASPANAPCTPAQLVAHQTYAVSIASQPLTIVAFYNISTTACYLRGYATIDAADAAGSAVPISVVHSGNYERSDPGPTSVIVYPGGGASFAIGSTTANGGGLHLITLTRLTLSVPGAKGQIQVPTTIMDSRAGATGPYPLTETALVAGPGGPRP
jgi:hypothetical protein